MIYSKKHPRHKQLIQVSPHEFGTGDFTIEMWIPAPIVYKVRRLKERRIFDCTVSPSEHETAAKLKAIGIDPKFLSFDHIDFDYEAELNELANDYEAMFPGDDE